MADDQREYGELIATVRTQTKILNKLENALEKLIGRDEFEYRIAALEQTVSTHHKQFSYRFEESERKIEGMQDKQQQLWTRSMVGTEKIANTERVLWAALTVAASVASIFVQSYM